MSVALKVFPVWTDKKIPLNHFINQVIPVTTSNFSNFSAAIKILFYSKNSDWLAVLISWTKPQVQARSHPNILAASVWLSKLYHIQVVDKVYSDSEKNKNLEKVLEGVDLNIPLTYADRFRIRKPGNWAAAIVSTAHVDGGCHTFVTRLLLIQDNRRRIAREMGRSILQEMFWEYIKWQLERTWPVRSWRSRECSELSLQQTGPVQRF